MMENLTITKEPGVSITFSLIGGEVEVNIVNDFASAAGGIDVCFDVTYDQAKQLKNWMVELFELSDPA